jgi:hypothetical protein
MTRRLFAQASLVAITVALGLTLGVGVAFANALVVVQLRGDDPREGLVTLTARQGGATFSCQTRGGTCRINEVPGGNYSVRFQPDEGPMGPPTQAMIPPSGTVTLHIAGH